MRKNMNDLLAGIVILYNPNSEVIKNIETYIEYLDVLYIVDNSPFENSQLIESLKKADKVHYIFHNENKGISYSLNEVLGLVKNRYKWLLTMDQDSRFADGSFYNYQSFLKQLPPNTYGICPVYSDKNSRAVLEKDLFTVVDRCITSGTIINVDISIKCGGFDENLFIDEVDFEFCYRCKKNGYKLLQYNKKILIHKIGESIFKSFLGFQFSILNENYLRNYYVYRNKLYISRKYPERKWQIYIELAKWIVKVCLFENNKIKKMKYAYKGYKDFQNKKMGRIN